MPIENLSENVRMPRLGKFHLGYKDPVKGYPVKTDYFVLEKDHPNKDAIQKIIGKEPKELKVLIPSEDAEDWCPQYYMSYELTHGLVCKGNGITAMRMVDVKTNAFPTKSTATTTMIDLDCDGKDCPMYKERKCREAMKLRFVLPDVPGLGVWQIDTGSINSILNINSCAKMIKTAFGRISNIPLKLTLEPISVNNPETGKKQTVFVLNLRTDVTLAQLADAARLHSKQFLIEAPDMVALYETQVNRDIKSLWGDDEQSESPVIEPEPVKEPPTVEVAAPPSPANPPATPHVEQEKPQMGDTDVPATVGDLCTWALSHGKTYTGTWVAQQVGEKTTAGIKDIKAAYLTIKEVSGWEAYKKGA
jgi:hypothetical protein